MVVEEEVDVEEVDVDDPPEEVEIDPVEVPWEEVVTGSSFPIHPPQISASEQSAASLSSCILNGLV